MKKEEPSSQPAAGTITFSIDDTREFTRALRARSQQKEREAQKAAKQQTSTPAIVSNDLVVVKQEEHLTKEDEQVEDVASEEEDDDDVDMDKLAKEVKVDEDELDEQRDTKVQSHSKARQRAVCRTLSTSADWGWTVAVTVGIGER